MPAFPSLRTLCSMVSAQPSITRKPDDAEDERGGEREDHEEEAGDEPDHGPLDDACGVPVEGGVGDLLHQLGVGGRQVLLDLPQDPLFVLGKRHLSHFRSSGPRRGDPSCCGIHSRARLRTASTRRWPRTFPRKAMRRTVPHRTRTEPGPDLVDRALQRSLATVARRRVAPPSGRLPARRRSPSRLGEEGPLVAGRSAPVPHQLLARDAEQADARARRRASWSSSPATRRRSAARSVGSAQGARAGDGAEVAEAHLELDGAGGDARRPAGATPRRRPAAPGGGRARRGRGGRRGTSPRGRSTSPPGRRPPRARRGSTPARGGGGRRRRPSASTSVVLGERGELADGARRRAR